MGEVALAKFALTDGQLAVLRYCRLEYDIPYEIALLALEAGISSERLIQYAKMKEAVGELTPEDFREISRVIRPDPALVQFLQNGQTYGNSVKSDEHSRNEERALVLIENVKIDRLYEDVVGETLSKDVDHLISIIQDEKISTGELVCLIKELERLDRVIDYFQLRKELEMPEDVALYFVKSMDLKATYSTIALDMDQDPDITHDGDWDFGVIDVVAIVCVFQVYIDQMTDYGFPVDQAWRIVTTIIKDEYHDDWKRAAEVAEQKEALFRRLCRKFRGIGGL